MKLGTGVSDLRILHLLLRAPTYIPIPRTIRRGDDGRLMGGSGDPAASVGESNVQLLPPLLRAFPSPASITAALDSPGLSRTLTGLSPRSPCSPLSSPSEATAGPVPPAPGDVQVLPLATPPPAFGGCSAPDLNMTVGGALPPVHTAPLRSSPPKPGPGLRLPSFEALGIAAPHPSRFVRSLSIDRAEVGGFARDAMEAPFRFPLPGDDLIDVLNEVGAEGIDASGASSSATTAGGRAIHSAVQHYIATLTPPAEAGEMHWHPPRTIGTSLPMDSPSTDRRNGVQASGNSPNASDAPPIVRTAGQRPPDLSRTSSGSQAWIDDAAQTLRTS